METKIILGGIGVIVGVILLMCGGFAIDCSNYGANSGHPTRWVFWGGGESACLINVGGQWIPTDKWVVNSGN